MLFGIEEVDGLVNVIFFLENIDVGFWIELIEVLIGFVWYFDLILF